MPRYKTPYGQPLYLRRNAVASIVNNFAQAGLGSWNIVNVIENEIFTDIKFEIGTALPSPLVAYITVRVDETEDTE